MSVVPTYLHDMSTNSFIATGHWVAAPDNCSVGYNLVAHNFMYLVEPITEAFHLGMRLFGM